MDYGDYDMNGGGPGTIALIVGAAFAFFVFIAIAYYAMKPKPVVAVAVSPNFNSNLEFEDDLEEGDLEDEVTNTTLVETNNSEPEVVSITENLSIPGNDEWTAPSKTKDYKVLGEINSTGTLTDVRVDVMGRDQGWGNICSLFGIEIFRGDESLGSNKLMIKSRESKQSLSPNPLKPYSIDWPANINVQQGDIVKMWIHGLWPGCKTFIKDVKVELNIDTISEGMTSQGGGRCLPPGAASKYRFYQGKDSHGNDITRIIIRRNDISRLVNACDERDNCQGFNSNGWLKHSIVDDDRWRNVRSFTGNCQGLYVKK